MNSRKERINIITSKIIFLWLICCSPLVYADGFITITQDSTNNWTITVDGDKTMPEEPEESNSYGFFENALYQTAGQKENNLWSQINCHLEQQRFVRAQQYADKQHPTQQISELKEPEKKQDDHEYIPGLTDFLNQQAKTHTIIPIRVVITNYKLAEGTRHMLNVLYNHFQITGISFVKNNILPIGANAIANRVSNDITPDSGSMSQTTEIEFIDNIIDQMNELNITTSIATNRTNLTKLAYTFNEPMNDDAMANNGLIAMQLATIINSNKALKTIKLYRLAYIEQAGKNHLNNTIKKLQAATIPTQLDTDDFIELIPCKNYTKIIISKNKTPHNANSLIEKLDSFLANSNHYGKRYTIELTNLALDSENLMKIFDMLQKNQRKNQNIDNIHIIENFVHSEMAAIYKNNKLNALFYRFNKTMPPYTGTINKKITTWLANIIVNNNHLERIDLNGCYFVAADDKTVVYEAIKANKQITTYNIDDFISTHPNKQNPNQLTVIIDGKLTAKPSLLSPQVDQIIDFLHTTNNMYQIEILNWVNLEAPRLAELFNQLIRMAVENENNKLASIIIAGNSFKDENAAVAMGEFFGNYYGPVKIKLFNNTISGDYITKILDILSKTRHNLMELDLSNNNIHEQGALLLETIIEKNTSLQKINLSKCTYDDNSAKSLIKAFAQRPDIAVGLPDRMLEFECMLPTGETADPKLTEESIINTYGIDIINPPITDASQAIKERNRLLAQLQNSSLVKICASQKNSKAPNNRCTDSTNFFNTVMFDSEEDIVKKLHLGDLKTWPNTPLDPVELELINKARVAQTAINRGIRDGKISTAATFSDDPQLLNDPAEEFEKVGKPLSEDELMANVYYDPYLQLAKTHLTITKKIERQPTKTTTAQTSSSENLQTEPLAKQSSSTPLTPSATSSTTTPTPHTPPATLPETNSSTGAQKRGWISSWWRSAATEQKTTPTVPPQEELAILNTKSAPITQQQNTPPQSASTAVPTIVTPPPTPITTPQEVKLAESSTTNNISPLDLKNYPPLQPLKKEVRIKKSKCKTRPNTANPVITTETPKDKISKENSYQSQTTLTQTTNISQEKKGLFSWLFSFSNRSKSAAPTTTTSEKPDPNQNSQTTSHSADIINPKQHWENAATKLFPKQILEETTIIQTHTKHFTESDHNDITEQRRSPTPEPINDQVESTNTNQAEDDLSPNIHPNTTTIWDWIDYNQRQLHNSNLDTVITTDPETSNIQPSANLAPAANSFITQPFAEPWETITSILVHGNFNEKRQLLNNLLFTPPLTPQQGPTIHPSSSEQFLRNLAQATSIYDLAAMNQADSPNLMPSYGIKFVNSPSQLNLTTNYGDPSESQEQGQDEAE